MADVVCPNCSRKEITKVQAHLFANYGGDNNGRFHDRVYMVGDKMAWFPKGHKNFGEDGLLNHSGDIYSDPEIMGYYTQACGGYCLNCSVELAVVIDFSNGIINKIKGVILMKDILSTADYGSVEIEGQYISTSGMFKSPGINKTKEKSKVKDEIFLMIFTPTIIYLAAVEIFDIDYLNWILLISVFVVFSLLFLCALGKNK